MLRAIDPISGKIVWEQASQSAWDGGVMSTAGNLVFQGDAAGQLNVYAADSGKFLTRVDLGTSVMSAPMTYRIAGTQYVAVLAGYGGGNLAIPFAPTSAAFRYGNEGRLIALKLDGGPLPKPDPQGDLPLAQPPTGRGLPAEIAQGAVLYNRYCSRCHVFGRAVLPDLRRISLATDGLFYDIVLKGIYASQGMARWDDVLSKADAQAIHAYILDSAWTAFNSSTTAAKRGSSP